MEVILKEKITNLGALGDVVRVKPGYARNFLVPQGKALEATPRNREIFETKRAELEAIAKERLEAAEAIAQKLVDKVVTIEAKAGEGGRLFGSLGARDLAAAFSEAGGVEVGKHQIRLPEGIIRQIGEFEIGVHLHTDVDVTVKVMVQSEDGAVAPYTEEAFADVHAAAASDDIAAVEEAETGASEEPVASEEE